MTRRHFNALAELVADVATHGGSIGAEALADRLADICERSNDRFDRDRFLTACLPVHPGCDDWCPYYGTTPHHAAKS
jgi:hypothetical protein